MCKCPECLSHCHKLFDPQSRRKYGTGGFKTNYIEIWGSSCINGSLAIASKALSTAAFRFHHLASCFAPLPKMRIGTSLTRPDQTSFTMDFRRSRSTSCQAQAKAGQAKPCWQCRAGSPSGLLPLPEGSEDVTHAVSLIPTLGARLANAEKTKHDPKQTAVEIVSQAP